MKIDILPNTAAPLTTVFIEGSAALVLNRDKSYFIHTAIARLSCVYHGQFGLCNRGDYEGCLKHPCLPCENFTNCEGPFDKVKDNIT